MKICVLTHTFPRSANDVSGSVSSAFMKELSDGLVQAGNEVIVVTPFDQDFKRQGDIFKIVTYKYIWPDSLHLLGYSRTMQADVSLKITAFLLLPFMFTSAFITLLRTVIREKVDVINAHWILPNGLIALFVSLLTGVPYVITLPGSDVYIARRFKIFGLVAAIVARFAAGITSNSAFLLNKILKMAPAGKLSEVIVYPVDISSFKPSDSGVGSLRKKMGLTNNDFVALAVGRMVYKKGFEYLIKATALITGKYKNLHLVLIGGGDLYQKLVDLAARLNVSEKVHFVGNIPRDKIGAYYNLADVFVAPSVVDAKGNVDGGPTVSYESMACGKVQIATDVLGVADFIKDGENGFVIPEKDEKALALAIERVIKDKGLTRKAEVINRGIAVTELGTKRIGERYTVFFEKALSGYTGEG